MTRNIFLSIVIPVKNEEVNIGRCLTSVINCIKDMQQVEVIVVDACSQDGTVEQALKFPVNIIQLESFWTHTASAGRYLGCLNTYGKYLFFIDADTTLELEFLEKALEFLEKNPDSGGIAGLDREIYFEGKKQVGQSANIHKRDLQVTKEVEYLGAAALFRRKALEEVMYFNPYLYSQEELDVGQRLKKNGWKLYSFPRPMSIHRTHSPEGIEIFRKQIKNNRFTGVGQLIRLSFSNGLFWGNIWRFKKFFLFLVLAVSMILAFVVFLFSGNKQIIVSECSVVAIVYFYLVFKKQSLKKAAISFSKWIVVIMNVGKGLVRCPQNIHSYPQNVKVIRKGN